MIWFFYLLVINIAAFVIFAADKSAARKGRRRVREATLFRLALAGGSLGGLAAMYVFRHKTRKRSFTVGIPLILAAQAALVFWLVNKR